MLPLPAVGRGWDGAGVGWGRPPRAPQMAWVPPSERVGETEDEGSLTDRMASLFGGKADTSRSRAATVGGFSTIPRGASMSPPKAQAEPEPPEPAAPPPPAQVDEKTKAKRRNLFSGWRKKEVELEPVPVVRRRSVVALAQAGGVSGGNGLETDGTYAREAARRASESAEREAKLREEMAAIAAAEEKVKQAAKTRFIPRKKSSGRVEAMQQMEKEKSSVAEPVIRRRSITKPAPAPAPAPEPEPEPEPVEEFQERAQPRQRSATIAARPGAGVGSGKCPVCTKSVYSMEEIKVEGLSFHKWCFRCTKCSKTCTAMNYASYQGLVYCKPCFIKSFKQNGNYDEGFGLEQHKRKWTKRG